MTRSVSPLDAVVRFVSDHAGLALAHRLDSAEAGIRRAMARARVADPDRYLDLLRLEPSALDDLLAELTVGETYFFREPAQFELLRRVALPELRARRGEAQVLRAWSAGCASGEEAYSLAILFEQEGLGERSHVLGTDLCQAALARAREAVYRAWALRGEAAADARPYLRPEGQLYRLAEGIRRRVTFRPLNLAHDVYPSFATGTWGLDLILCRNVLIYFDREVTRRVAGRLFECLAEGGWLITASSDPPVAEDAPFEVVATEQGVFYRRPSVPAPPPSTEPAGAASVLDETEPSLDLPGRTEEPGAEREVFADPSGAEPVEEEQGPRTLASPDAASNGAGQLAQARAALARGEYARAAELAREPGADPAAAAVRVRALAALDAAEAAGVCAAAVNLHPLSTELAYLQAVLLLGGGRDAAELLRRVLYLDGTLAVAHFTLGSVLQRLGDAAGARRAYRNARDLCAARPAEEAVPLADGEQAGRLAEAAAAELALLASAERRAP
jgi:chemotaxis protein methyltransferase CheR